jgi:hypothetical protein
VLSKGDNTFYHDINKILSNNNLSEEDKLSVINLHKIIVEIYYIMSDIHNSLTNEYKYHLIYYLFGNENTNILTN